MANDQRRNPFPAQYSNKGPQCFGAITCGDNPFLLARKVKNLKVFLSDQGMAFECDEVVKPSGISKRIK